MQSCGTARGADPTQLVLTAATGLGARELAPFFGSLRGCGYAGRVCLFASDVPGPVLARLRAMGVEVRSFAHAWDRAVRMVPSARFFLFREYLRRAEGVERVLLTDARDVVFQRAPLEADFAGAVWAVLEDAATPIAATINRAWIAQAYGEAEARALEHLPPSCAGTVLGAADAVRGYLDLLCAELEDIRPDFFSSDQAAHIRLVHRGLVPRLAVCADGHGPVRTLGTVPPQRLELDAQGRVLGVHGEPAAIVHQYDRHPALAGSLRRRCTPGALGRCAVFAPPPAGQKKFGNPRPRA